MYSYLMDHQNLALFSFPIDPAYHHDLNLLVV